jgi:hypothetical protein
MRTDSQFPLGGMLPFTIDELVRAHLLIGQPEEEARALWSEAIAGLVAQRDSGAECWGISLAEGTLLALSLLSEDLHDRVNRYRTAGWKDNYPHWRRTLAPDELRHREEEYRLQEQAWQESRKQLRQALFGNEPLA